MKTKFLLIPLLALLITSCSTAYKSGQTPDDVYYSPLRVENGDDDKEENKDEVRNTSTSNEDREIRMATRDRRWRDIDYDYDYRYDPYRYGYSYGYYYNPYYCRYPVYISNRTIVNPKNNTARMANLSSFTHTSVLTSNGKTGTSSISNTRAYNNSNNGNRSGGFIRNVILPAVTGSGSSGSSGSSNNTRSYSPSSSGSNSSGSSSGSSRPVSRPSRGN